MTKKISLILCAVLFFGALHATPAWADNDRARSAFTYGERKEWSQALSEAKASDDPILIKLIDWQYALDPDSGASFEDISNFIDENPNWPDQKKLRIRAELALKGSAVPGSDIITWFGDDAPITGVGKMALAEALSHSKTGSQEKITSLIREAWRGGDFDEAQTKTIIENHGAALRREDDIARIDRLLWEEKITSAKWTLSRVPADYQKLFKARMALIEDKHLAIIAVVQVPAALKKDPGLIYDRMRFRLRRDDEKGVREMLLAAPAKVPYPEKWWKMREVQIREAIAEKNFATAKKLLANHGQTEGGEYAEANWLEGWLQTEFLNQPKLGITSFIRVYNAVRFPVSKARAAYWAGRAAEKAGQTEASHSWYASAASYPTTFYGQLATLKSHGGAPLHLPEPLVATSDEERAFNADERMKAAELCLQIGEYDLARHMVSHLVENAESDSAAAQAAELGRRLDHAHISVHASKKALQQNIVLIDAGYPTLKMPSDLTIEPALTLAIIRQESEFDAHAKSPTGALGVMQLMPATAKETAHKKGMDFAASRLGETSYNMTLGSHYLARLINSYDGSYIMAIAAYNAGPGNVHRWVKTFGTPGNDADNAINWIEKIPYDETRNYVQRVLENVQVYRHIENRDEELKLAEDLMR